MRPCGNCGGPLPDDARFCNHCGQTIAAAGPPKRTGSMRVCGMCGILAPTSKTECIACKADIRGAPTVPARDDEHYWVCVLECDFACRGCGMRSPLDSLDLDGTVECRRCGLQQAFDVDQWKEALIFAQDVADCAGPPGRLGKEPVANNPYAELGVAHTYAEKTLSGMIIDAEGMKPRTLRLRATPGVPLCERCHVPLEVEVSDEYKTRTTCPRCRDQAIYDTPDEAFDVNADIEAVLADDHRCDREAVRVQAAPGGAAVAVSCPKCNASLPVSDGTSMVNCGYCGTPCRIPSRLMAKLSHAAPMPKRWWILFDDDSYLRLGVDPDADDDDDDDDDDDHDHDFEDDKMARVRAAQAAEAQSRVQATAPQPSNGPMVIGAVLGVLAVVGVVGVIISILHGRAKAPPPEEKETTATSAAKKPKKSDDAEEAAAAAAAVAIDRSKFNDLKGCTCKSGKDTRQLAVRIDVQGMGMVVGEDDGMVANFDLSWLADSGGNYFLTHDKDAGAPPRKVKGRALAVGVACNGDVFAVVARDRVTAWSMKEQKMLWDEKLEGEYTAAASPSKTGLGIQCNTVAVTGTTLRVPFGKGKTKALNMTNGAAAK